MHFAPETARRLLYEHFGYLTFRSGQEEIIRSIAEGKDTLVVMPTGGGKSLCYQIPALLGEGCALVISPLIALMKDQVDSLTRARIPATFINSSLAWGEIQQRILDARAGKYKLLYVAPERLENEHFLEALRHVKISFLAVDEAHCVSEWGHDFRPSYLFIAKAVEKLGKIPVIALTATATPEVQDDIMFYLHMRSPQKFIRGFDRPNLRYSTERTEKKTLRLVDICKEAKGSVIVYCGSRKRVEQYASELLKYRVEAEAYHAGMSEEARRYVQERFKQGSSNVLVATSAFGMGIDKADVRAVVHCDLTPTMEAYYQEAGRAGRDLKESTCTMLYHPTDRKLQEFFVQMSFPDLRSIENVYSVLYDLHGTPMGMRTDAPVLLDDAQIANHAGVQQTVASSVLALFERYGVLHRGAVNGLAKIQFSTSRDRLIEYYRNTASAERKQALEVLLRSVGSEALEEPVMLDLNDVVRKHDIHFDSLTNALKAFSYARLIEYDAPGTTGGLTLLLERMPVNSLPINFEDLAERRERAFKKLDVVQRYAETPECKRNFILHYFQEYDIRTDCGRCSSCIRPEKKGIIRSARQEYLLQQVLGVASELGGRFGRTVLADVLAGKDSSRVRQFALHGAKYFDRGKNFSRDEILAEIDSAISERLLHLSSEIYPTVSVTEKGYERLKNIPQPFNSRRVVPEHQAATVERLKKLRGEIAVQENIPPEKVLDDLSLNRIAEIMPKSPAEFRKIPGLNINFSLQYGELFFNALQSERNAAGSHKAAPELPTRLKKTIECAQQGWSLEKIAQERGLSPATIAQHLQEAIEFGLSFPREQFVSDELFGAVWELLKKDARVALREVRAAVGSGYEYPLLRVATAFVRRELGTKRR